MLKCTFICNFFAKILLPSLWCSWPIQWCPVRTPNCNMKVQHKFSAPLPTSSINVQLRKSWDQEPMSSAAYIAIAKREAKKGTMLFCGAFFPFSKQTLRRDRPVWNSHLITKWKLPSGLLRRSFDSNVT